MDNTLSDTQQAGCNDTSQNEDSKEEEIEITVPHGTVNHMTNASGDSSGDEHKNFLRIFKKLGGSGSVRKSERTAKYSMNKVLWCAESGAYSGGGYCNSQLSSGKQRIKAYTLGGNQVGLLGLKPFGTFPSKWEVHSLLTTPGWVKILCDPIADETPQEGKHYELLDASWVPKTVMFAMAPGREPIIGVPMDRLGSYDALYLQVLTSKAEIVPRSMKEISQEYRMAMENNTDPDKKIDYEI